MFPSQNTLKNRVDSTGQSLSTQPVALAQAVFADLQCVCISEVTGISSFKLEAISGNFTKDPSDDGDSILIQPSGYKWNNTGAAN